MIPARIVGILLLALPVTTYASETSVANYCNSAAIHAAEAREVPTNVLLALTLVETGRTRSGEFEPWPWTVNIAGRGHWFNTRTEAENFVAEKYAEGTRSFDIGCFQINHRWHGQAFTSINQMFDPLANANYAAKFISSLYAESGSWSWAAGAYHSRTTALATKYRIRFDQILTTISDHHPETRPITTASNTRPRLSSWSPISPPDSNYAINGSLAGGLVSRTGASLLGATSGALF